MKSKTNFKQERQEVNSLTETEGEKVKKVLSLLAMVAMVSMTTQTADAVEGMSNNFINTAIGDNGTLGTGGNTSPGLQYDATGTGTFGVDDYLTPGTPWEVFGVETNETGLNTNNNTQFAGGAISSSSLTDISAGSTFDSHVRWEGFFGSSYSITHDYFFNAGDERINIITNITALGDLTDVRFVRAIDPDPDVNTFGSFFTINGRGFDANTDGDFDDAGDVAPENWVHSEGSSTGLTLGLFSNSSITHNTGVDAPSGIWTDDPDFYLSGQDDGDGDYSIGLGFDIGDLDQGESVDIEYAYVMGGSLETADIPDDPKAIPEPATMALFGLGSLGLAARRKLKK